jgi:hypothetical protein
MMAQPARHYDEAGKLYPPAVLKWVSDQYGRYMHHGSAVMDENYFPIIWTNDGRRSLWIDRFVSGEI